MSAIVTAPLFKPAEVCEFLRISRASFYRFAAEGRLETIRLGPGSGANLRVTQAALEAFLAGPNHSHEREEA